MKKVGLVWRGLMCAAAMGVAMLLVPVAASASAHDTGDHPSIAADGPLAHQDAISSSASDGATLAGGHRLHCHLLSNPVMAVGANQSRDDGYAVAPVRVIAGIVAGHVCAFSPSALPIPIAAPPPYILFGNFRS